MAKQAKEVCADDASDVRLLRGLGEDGGPRHKVHELDYGAESKPEERVTGDR